jgi:FMN phosphatase YigB (HAD superfamily)
MGYDLYVIKSEHDIKYGNFALSELHNFIDEWYINDEYSYSHQIWRSWREGFYTNDDDEKVYFPEDLEGFFFDIHCPESARDVADKLDAFAGHDINVASFTDWLRFWVGKDARFSLSM